MAQNEAKNFLVNCASLWVALIVFLVGIMFSSDAKGETNFELFKNQLAKPASSYQVEFVEGDVQRDPSNAIIMVSGHPGIIQSQRHYYATYQSNAFLLIQKPETIAVDRVHTNFVLFKDCGRYENQGWVRRDSAFVRLIDLNATSKSPELQHIADEVRLAENKAQCASLLGLPKIEISTIKWDRNNFFGTTFTGLYVQGTVSIDNNGRVSGATYSVSGKTTESGEIAYSYSHETNISTLPDIIEKHIIQAGDPVYAIENSFKIKILEHRSMTNRFAADTFMSRVKTAWYMISNGIVLAKLEGRFMSEEDGVKLKLVTPSKKLRTEHTARIFVAFFVLSSVAVLVLMLKKNGFNKKHKLNNASK